MRHLLLDQPVSSAQVCRLTGEEYHYLAHVRRLRPGDTVEAVDAGGHPATLAVTSVGTGEIVLQVLSVGDPDSASGFPPVTLYQAIPKGRKFDDIVRMAVQAGVSRIVPMVTSRSVVRDTASFQGRMDRLQRVAKEAVQQSGAPRAVLIEPPQLLSKLTSRGTAASARHLSLVLTPGTLEQRSLHDYLSQVPSAVDVCVGPEGGLTDEEIAYLRMQGFQALSLGPQILRTEVAAFYAVAGIRTLLLEHDEWHLNDNPRE